MKPISHHLLPWARKELSNFKTNKQILNKVSRTKIEYRRLMSQKTNSGKNLMPEPPIFNILSVHSTGHEQLFQAHVSHAPIQFLYLTWTFHCKFQQTVSSAVTAHKGWSNHPGCLLQTHQAQRIACESLQGLERKPMKTSKLSIHTQAEMDMARAVFCKLSDVQKPRRQILLTLTTEIYFL